jgi:hypothetical protein
MASNPGLWAETHFVGDRGNGLRVWDFFPWAGEVKALHPKDHVLFGTKPCEM